MIKMEACNKCVVYNTVTDKLHKEYGKKERKG